MIEIKKATQGLYDYLDKKVMPQLPAGKQFVAGMVLGLVGNQAEEMLRALGENELMKSLNLINGDQIDIDRVFAAAKAQFEKTPDLPIDIPLIGRLNFRLDDLRDLYQIISR